MDKVLSERLSDELAAGQSREYLFDQVPALMSILEGNVHIVWMTMGDYHAQVDVPNCIRDCLGKQMAPMLILAGVLDTQVPIDDEYLPARAKAMFPKEAWINPQGGHLGPSKVGVWPDPLIFKQVALIPWLVKTHWKYKGRGQGSGVRSGVG